MTASIRRRDVLRTSAAALAALAVRDARGEARKRIRMRTYTYKKGR